MIHIIMLFLIPAVMVGVVLDLFFLFSRYCCCKHTRKAATSTSALLLPRPWFKQMNLQNPVQLKLSLLLPIFHLLAPPQHYPPIIMGALNPSHQLSK